MLYVLSAPRVPRCPFGHEMRIEQESSFCMICARHYERCFESHCILLRDHAGPCKPLQELIHLSGWHRDS